MFREGEQLAATPIDLGRGVPPSVQGEQLRARTMGQELVTTLRPILFPEDESDG